MAIEKKLATAVPGKKIIVNTAIAFILALSDNVASAIRRELSAVAKFIASLCCCTRLPMVARAFSIRRGEDFKLVPSGNGLRT